MNRAILGHARNAWLVIRNAKGGSVKDSAQEEMIDVYDANAHPLGIVAPRKGLFLEKGRFMLYVLGVLQNREGRFLITRRSFDKKWAAGWWEIPGGGVLAGESPVQAVKREVFEETGIDVHAYEPQLLYRYENVDLARGDNYINHIFRFMLDFDKGDVVVQPDEVIDFTLASWEDIEKLSDQGMFLHFERLRTALEKTERP